MSVILVTGGRDYNDQVRVFNELSRLSPKLVIHGGARGADGLADLWCVTTGVHVARVPALWDALGRGAGPRRNVVLVEMARRLGASVLAFPGGSGTADCVRRARAAGLVVEVVE